MVVRSNRTNASTAFADASGSANSRMGDSFARKVEGPNKAALSSASDASADARGKNKAMSTASKFFTAGQKLDTTRGTVEGSQPKKLAKERNVEEKSKDQAMIKASDEASAGARRAKARMESSSTGGIMYDKSKRSSWGTTNGCKADKQELAKASNDSEEGRGACKSRNVESKVFGEGPAEQVRTGKAHKASIQANMPTKMQSSRTTAEDMAADDACSKQQDSNATAQRAHFMKNHASKIFSNTPPKANGRSDGRKNAGCTGGIFADEKPAMKAAKQAVPSLHTSTDIFKADIAPEHKACRSAVHDKNAGADVFAPASNTEAPKTSRAAMHDKNAGSSVFSDAKPEHKMSRGGVCYANMKGSDVFSDGTW